MMYQESLLIILSIAVLVIVIHLLLQNLMKQHQYHNKNKTKKNYPDAFDSSFDTFDTPSDNNYGLHHVSNFIRGLSHSFNQQNKYIRVYSILYFKFLQIYRLSFLAVNTKKYHLLENELYMTQLFCHQNAHYLTSEMLKCTEKFLFIIQEDLINDLKTDRNNYNNQSSSNPDESNIYILKEAFLQKHNNLLKQLFTDLQHLRSLINKEIGQDKKGKEFSNLF